MATMGKIMSTGGDVVLFLKEQHQQVKGMFNAVKTSHGEARAQAFVALRRMLAVHETAEEEIVHPAARRALPNGEAIVAQRLQEEKQAKLALAELENLPVDSLQFEQKFVSFEADVIAHAELEEREEFDRLAETLDPSNLEKMRKAAIFAESIAPTRPHPGIESQAANMLVGPFAAMLDRARDALTNKN